MKKDKPYDDAFKLLAEEDAEALLLLLGELDPGEKAEITPLHRELRISTRSQESGAIWGWIFWCLARYAIIPKTW